MRKFILSIAAAASVMAIAAPASAQSWQRPGQSYQGNYGAARSLQVRIDRVQRDIERLAQRRAITRDEYNGLRHEARDLERRLRDRARNGLSNRERYDIAARINRLEAHVAHEVRDGRSWRYRW